MTREGRERELMNTPGAIYWSLLGEEDETHVWRLFDNNERTNNAVMIEDVRRRTDGTSTRRLACRCGDAYQFRTIEGTP